MLVFLLFGLFLFLVALGVPIGHAMLPAIFVTLIVGFDIPLTQVISSLLHGVDQWIWLAVPLFLMLGNLMNQTGITDKLISLCQEIVGHITSGLSHVNIVASVLMAGMQGSCSADAAAIGTILIPQMKKAGYPAGYASAITATSSIIGPLIPPSIGLIVIAVLGRMSVLRLWLAGAAPGFILGLALIIAGYIMGKRKGFPRTERRPSLKRIATAGVIAAPALVIPIILLGGMRLGVFSATEAGACGVVYAMIVGLFVYRKLNLAGYYNVAMSTVRLMGPLMWIVTMAMVFSTVIGRLNVGPAFAETLMGISDNPIVFKLLISAIVLFLGCIMESMGITLILYPLLHIAARAYGIDPIYFGVFYYYVVIVGQCTPPVGPSMFITNATAGCSMVDYVREGWPLLATQFLLIPPFIFFPQLFLFLPNLVMGPP